MTDLKTTAGKIEDLDNKLAESRVPLGEGEPAARTPARLPIVGGTSVESQLNDATSLLHSVRTMIAERHAHPDLGTAPCEPVETGKENVLGYQRGDLLCLHNFSDRSVDLGPVELGPYGYAWLPA